jgi:hypothetical protein
MTMQLEEMEARPEVRHAVALSVPSLIEVAEASAPQQGLTLPSGRHVAIDSAPHADRLTVRSRTGEIVLRVELTDAGPVLSFTGATIELAATRALRLRADQVDVLALGDITVSAGGALRERVGADHHTLVGGAERLEAARVEVQANEGAVAVRAMQHIALDGEHIGLNDDPEPAPFAWSAIAEEG